MKVANAVQQLQSVLMKHYEVPRIVLGLSRDTGFVYMGISRTGAEDVLAVEGVGEASPQTDWLFNRQKLTAEITDSSTLIKALVIKAEDDRIVGGMKLMKRYYADLQGRFSTTSWLGSTPSGPTTTRNC